MADAGSLYLRLQRYDDNDGGGGVTFTEGADGSGGVNGKEGDGDNLPNPVKRVSFDSAESGWEPTTFLPTLPPETTAATAAAAVIEGLIGPSMVALSSTDGDNDNNYGHPRFIEEEEEEEREGRRARRGGERESGPRRGAASSRAGAVSMIFDKIGVMDGNGREGRGLVGRSPPPKLPFCVCREHNDQNKKNRTTY